MSEFFFGIGFGLVVGIFTMAIFSISNWGGASMIDFILGSFVGGTIGIIGSAILIYNKKSR